MYQLAVLSLLLQFADCPFAILSSEAAQKARDASRNKSGIGGKTRMPEKLKDYFKLPGKFISNFPTKIFRRDGSEREMDWLMLVEDGRGEFLIHAEFQSYAVDDEKIALQGLLASIQKAAPDAEIYGFRYTGEAIAHMENTPCDVAFLDIEMKGMNGIEVGGGYKISPFIDRY